MTCFAHRPLCFGATAASRVWVVPSGWYRAVWSGIYASAFFAFPAGWVSKSDPEAAEVSGWAGGADGEPAGAAGTLTVEVRLFAPGVLHLCLISCCDMNSVTICWSRLDKREADGGATFMTHIAKMLETFLKTFDLQVLMKNIVANLVLVNLMLGL